MISDLSPLKTGTDRFLPIPLSRQIRHLTQATLGARGADPRMFETTAVVLPLSSSHIAIALLVRNAVIRQVHLTSLSVSRRYHQAVEWSSA